ncbi:hypothetical protein SAMN02927900_06491 [Rhizobium mongolense subsp. loessense]|uniref:Transposase n=1 Tax=Rhizobium mongolense subsp. loessense TaxID=158890 RepID=A0A1G4UAY7_9HYPH|nr:hypothetical protein SAMN02927900_06491 [Rhizobium mongolense subsp. loessense]
MKKITTVGLDLAKSVFQVHGIAEEGDVIILAHCVDRRCWTSFAHCGLAS